MKYINDKYNIISLSDVLLGNIYTDDIVRENTGVDSIRILPDGSICPSTYLISEEYSNRYSIKEDNVMSKINFEDFVTVPIPVSCSSCVIKNRCRGGVYDRRILWYGSLNKRDPYCPFENGDELPKERFKILKKKRVSVHDGYLPTMFFKNKE